MIIPDINLLVYAYAADNPFHAKAKCWWEDALNSDQIVGLPWSTSLGFIRLMSNRRLLSNPIAAEYATSIVAEWHALPNTGVIEPSKNHLGVLRQLLSESLGSSKLVMDAHLAAIAIAHHAVVHSNDTDFGRFSGLKWHNPLA